MKQIKKKKLKLFLHFTLPLFQIIHSCFVLFCFEKTVEEPLGMSSLSVTCGLTGTL